MTESGVKLVYFDLCGEKFAFNMEYLVEIVQIRDTAITPFFSPIPFIRGEWSYRQHTIDIIDLRDFFGLEHQRIWRAAGEPAEKTPEDQYKAVQDEGEEVKEGGIEKEHSKNIVVVKIRKQLFGLFTDTVLQIAPLTAFYEYPNMISTLPRKYVAGVTVNNKELVLILAIEEFMKEAEVNTLPLS